MWRRKRGSESVCRVCGYDDGDERWGVGDIPQYAICDCCGAESGVDDYSRRIARRYRDEWIQRGCVWSTPRERPDEWTFRRQAVQIPEVGR